MRGLYATIALVVFSVVILRAQDAHPCGSTEYLKALIKQDPKIEEYLDQQEARIAALKKGIELQEVTTRIIPVVVHVIYNTDEQNVSDEDIEYQLQQLNEGFAGEHSNPMGAFSPSLKANTQFEFCLAHTAPDGTTTTGIERRQTNVEQFQLDDLMKYYSSGGLDAWDANVYMNIWVCVTNGTCYGQFPGTGNIRTYGIVMHYNYFANGDSRINGTGEICTHEMGHCLNLRHSWGDDQGACTGTDFCTDTPNEALHVAMDSVGWLTDVGITITDDCSPSSPGIMYMNFMDYANSRTYANFTPDQKTRMHATFATGGPLEALGSSTACNEPSDCVTPSSLYITSLKRTSAILRWTAIENATSYGIRYRKQGTTTWSTATSNTNSHNITGLTKNVNYEAQVQTVSSSCTSTYSFSWTFKTPMSDPATTLTTPTPTLANGSTNVSVDPTLTWSAVNGVYIYEFQYSTSSDMSNAIQMNRGAAFVELHLLMYNATYYYRIRAVGDDVVGAWSATRNFTTVDGTLATPNVITPLNEATDVNVPVYCRWSPSTNATGYDYEYSLNSDMSDASQINTTFANTSKANVDYNTTCYWRVRATNGTQASDWTDVYSFTTGAYILGTPQLTMPTDNSVDVSLNPTLDWNTVADAEEYTVEYALTDDFQSATSITTSSSSADLSSLAYGTQYFWRVSASNVDATSDWSATRNFTTLYEPLTAPTLDAPLSGTTNVSTSPTLSWDEVTNATEYTLHYSTSSSFNSYSAVYTANTYKDLTGLSSNTTYYWRVLATGTGYSPSAWSQVWNYKTAKGRRKESFPFEPGAGSVAITQPSLRVFPNPVSYTATAEITLAQKGFVKLVVCDLLGVEWTILLDGELAAGTTMIDLDLAQLPSGTYLCRLENGDYLVNTPLVIVR